MTPAERLQKLLPNLPISGVLEQLKEAVVGSDVSALTAPPGSGKTLLAPTWLWEHLGFQRVYVLVPRRVNARLPVLLLREELGPLVGYRVRFEQQWDERETRIGYLTYGTALRAFTDHPPGSDDLVIFDEFHERPWEADLLWAYLHRRSGPRLLLMSATLDATQLPEATPLVQSDGRLHQVELSWESTEPMLLARPDSLTSLVRERSAELRGSDGGEQLIFLPGIAAIRQVESALRADPLPGPIDILHSSLSENEIRRVVERRADEGFRRILSTDLAESSVTLPGVTVVIDSGLQRRPRRDGLDLGITLETVRAAGASLTQRAGRAGRLRAGRCHRLFTRQDERARDPFLRPEISGLGGKTLALQLASLRLLESWSELSWLSSPDPAVLQEGQEWLSQHGLLRNGRLTARGEQVVLSTCPPRAGLFGSLAREAGWPVDTSVEWMSALSGEGLRPHPQSQELADRLSDKAWRASCDPRLSERLRRIYSAPTASNAPSSAPLCTAYSDTLVALRGDRAVPAFGRTEALRFNTSHPPAGPYALVLATHPGGASGPSSSVSLYHPLSLDEVWDAFFDQMEERVERSWDHETLSVRETRRTMLGQLVLEQSSREAKPGPDTAEVLWENLKASDLGDSYQQLTRRLQLYQEWLPGSVDDLYDALQAPLESNLATALAQHYLQTVSRWTKKSPDELAVHVHGLLGYQLGRRLDQELPTSVQLPRRRQPTPVHYPSDGAPFVASKLQDFFGWRPPQLLGGTLKLACHLLAPSGRPVQITQDLLGFWRGSYAQVRKDLRGRYPKHDWPESPP